MTATSATFAECEQLLAAWGVGPLLRATEPASGSINATLLVQTPRGAYALRASLGAEPAAIAREHAVIAYAANRGVPAVAPLPLPDGNTMLEQGGSHYALFPLARGAQRQREELTQSDAAAMGRCLAELHTALADAPAHLVRVRSFAIDRNSALAAIERSLTLAQSDPLLVRHLQGQRAYLKGGDEANVDLSPLPQQLIHGDFTETNLFFDRGAVSAIIDWENTYLTPRAWEVARTLHLALEFAPALCAALLDGYRSRQVLLLHELDLAMRGYAQMRAHDLWLIEALLVGGNQRLRRLLPPDGFQPLLPRWLALQAQLT
jgi:Ser/Thr protein kinase RdoA (MazF antagonist)